MTSYDLWLQQGIEQHFGGADYLPGYPVKCSYCGSHEYPPVAERLLGQTHCPDDDDPDNPVGVYVVDYEHDFSYDDPAIP